MPKVASYTDTIGQSVRGSIGAVLYALDMTQAEMAAAIGLSASAFGEKMRDVRRWKVSELENILIIAEKRGYKCRFLIGKET